MEKKLDFFNLSISEALKECLSLASLALDLSYASIIYENKEIARETVDISDFIDRLVETIIIRYGIATKSFEDARNLMPTVRAAYMMDKISDSAQKIAKMVLNEKKLLNEVKIALMRGKEVVGLAKVDKKSKLRNLTCEEAAMKLSVGLDVLAVKRNAEWIINPESDFRFKLNDVVVLRGTQEVLEFFGIFTKVQGELNERIIEMLKEIKDCSEMCLYLGYSALLYDSKGLASGAMSYRRKLLNLKGELRIKLVEEFQGKNDKLVNTLEFVDVLDEISAAGEKLASSIRGGGRLHPILERVDDEAKEQFMLIKVEERSIWTNKTVGEMLLDDRIGVKIIAIKRRGRWIFDLTDDTRINAGDLILLGGYKIGIKSLEEIGGEVREE